MENRRWLGRLSWSLVYGLGTQLPTLISFVLVARYVAPDSFGTMAIAWLVAGVGQILLLETVGDALVRRTEVDHRDRDTTFWLCLALGVLLALATAAFAEPAARFFGDPVLAAVLPVLSVRLVFDALAIVPDALLRRAYAVRAIAVRGLMANSLAAVAAVALAAAGHGVWALVAQQVVLGGIGAAVAWSASPFLPGLPRARPAADVWRYASHSSLFRSVDFSSANLDRFLVGRYRSTGDLGLYAVALRVQLLLLELVVGNALRLVALPLFSQLNAEAPALRQAFLRSLSVVAAAAFPCMVGAAALAGTLVPFAFGEAWRPAVPVVQILLVEAMVTALAMLNSALLRALDKPQQWLLVQSVAFAAGTLLVWAAVWHSVALVAAAVLAKALLVFPLHLCLARRACGFSLVEYFRALLAPAVSSAAMAMVVLLVDAWLVHWLPPAARLGVGMLFGVAVYLIMMLVAFRGDVERMLGGSLSLGRQAVTASRT